MKIGLIMPNTTRLLIRLQIANTTRIIPIVLNNSPEEEDFCILLPVILRSKRMGNVPNAKLSIVNHPTRKLPVDKVQICIDCVKPQGKKKVAIPIINAHHEPLLFLLKQVNTHHHKVALHLMTHKRFRPNTHKTTDIIILSTVLIVPDN